jgi:hypothetical protein
MADRPPAAPPVPERHPGRLNLDDLKQLAVELQPCSCLQQHRRPHLDLACLQGFARRDHAQPVQRAIQVGHQRAGPQQVQDHGPDHDSETAARLKVAYGTLALAARQTGVASADSWPQRIHQYLATHPPGRHAQ